MKMLKLLIVCLFVCILFVEKARAADGCRISGGSLIYTSSNSYLLGVDLGSGLSLALGGKIYKLSPTINSTVSCTIPWAKIVDPPVINGCIYGNPSISVPGVSAVCLTCQYGDLVNYTSTVECNLDDYSWALGAAAGLFGVFVIRRRNKL